MLVGVKLLYTHVYYVTAQNGFYFLLVFNYNWSYFTEVEKFWFFRIKISN